MWCQITSQVRDFFIDVTWEIYPSSTSGQANFWTNDHSNILLKRDGTCVSLQGNYHQDMAVWIPLDCLQHISLCPYLTCGWGIHVGFLRLARHISEIFLSMAYNTDEINRQIIMLILNWWIDMAPCMTVLIEGKFMERNSKVTYYVIYTRKLVKSAQTGCDPHYIINIWILHKVHRRLWH